MGQIRIYTLKTWQDANDKPASSMQAAALWAPDLPTLFREFDSFASRIPREQRVNVFYSLAEVEDYPKTGRHMTRQTAIAFDIERLGEHDAKDVAECVIDTLGLDWDKTGLVFSGHGIHVIIELTKPFDDHGEFARLEPAYKILCAKVQQALVLKGFAVKQSESDSKYATCHVDTGVFKDTQLLRLPGTTNRKEGMPDVSAMALQVDLEPQDFDLSLVSGAPELASTDSVPVSLFQSYGAVDEQGMIDGCEFYKQGVERPESFDEKEWYAFLSLVGRLPDGAEKAHKYSKGHPKYSKDETNLKLRQALTASGPRTCGGIEKVWQNPKCSDCPNKGKVGCPLQIRSPEFIKTKDTGFHTVIYADNGTPKGRPIPNYVDLVKYFKSQHEYISTEDGRVFVYTGKFWEEKAPSRIHEFAHTHFSPKPNDAICREFHCFLKRTNLKRTDWLETTTLCKINMKNGILDINTMDLLPHSSDFGFRTLIDYDFDSNMYPEKFMKFMDEITLGRPNLSETLLQIMGYFVSGDTYWEHLVPILYGTTCNGKSVFVNILKMLVSKKEYSNAMLREMKRAEDMTSLDGKRFNISEEASSGDFLDSSSLKMLSAGGTYQARYRYGHQYEIENRTKIMVICNDPPDIRESIQALARRIVLIPFDADFRGREDKFLLDKIKPECPGILHMVLQAYKRMKQNGGLFKAEEITVETMELIEGSDYFAEWVREHLHFENVDSNKKAFSDDIYCKYSFCAGRDGLEPLNKNVFFNTLYKRFPMFKQRKTNSGNRRGLMGVHLVQMPEVGV